MFHLSVQHAGISNDIDEAFRIVKEAGFDGLDVSMDHIAPTELLRKGNIPDIMVNGSEQDILDWFRPHKEASEKYGLDCYQAHSIFPSLWRTGENAEYNAWAIEAHKKLIRVCAYLDCRNLVIHPFYRNWENRLLPEEEKQINIESYAKLIPVAKEYGVTVLLENMFYTDSHASHEHPIRYVGCCGHAEEAVDYIDTLNDIAGSEVFGFCLDTGHSVLGGEDIYVMMHQLGKRIKAFHTHDNNGMNDDHMAPYTGVLDWNRFIKGLAEIEFHDTLSFETFGIFRYADYDAMLNMLKYIERTGRLFSKKAEELEKQMKSAK